MGGRIRGGTSGQAATSAYAPTWAAEEMRHNQERRQEMRDSTIEDIGGSRERVNQARERTGRIGTAVEGGYNRMLEESPHGYGREQFAEFAQTGGFNPGQEAAFMRAGTRPNAAVYDALNRNLQRRSAITGGSSPVFNSSTASLARQAGNTMAERGTDTRVALDRERRQGQQFGIEGLRTTRNDIARNQNMALGGLQRAYESVPGEEAMAAGQLDQDQIRNLQEQIQMGSLTSDNIRILAGLRESQPSLFDNIMRGVSAVGGAAGSVMTGIGGL